MNAHADKTQENTVSDHRRKSQSVASAVSQKQSVSVSAFQFVDNRPEAIVQRRLQEAANKSPQVSQLRAFQDMANNSPQAKQATQFQAMSDNHSVEAQEPIQKKDNNTGLPNNLKTGIENLSKMSLDDVKVHRNSDKPAQLQAHAYAQGTDIHLGPGQEKHLPHETWHVVQQKQGRVKPTTQMKGKVNVNDDAGLEKEADLMGTKALQFVDNRANFTIQNKLKDADIGATKEKQLNKGIIQKTVYPFKTPAHPTAAETGIINDANAIDALTDAAYANTMARLQASVAHVAVPLTRAMFPGATVGHFANMIIRLLGQDNALKAAAVGYVIEDQVTFGGHLPAAAGAQVGVGNAILDFVITHGADAARRRGIVDVTSSGQLGHVLNKDFSSANFPIVWESVYPSIDFTALGGGAVAMAPATAALVNTVKGRHASEYVKQRLYRINRVLDLHYNGIKYNDQQFHKIGTRLSSFINSLPNAGPWSGIYTGVTNNYIRQVNELLPADTQLETLADIIQNAQNKYLVAGNPLW